MNESRNIKKDFTNPIKPDDIRFKEPKQPLIKKYASDNLNTNDTQVSNVSENRLIYKNEIAVESGSRSRAQSNKSQSEKHNEGYSLTSSPSTKHKFIQGIDQTSTHTTIQVLTPFKEKFNNPYAKAFGNATFQNNKEQKSFVDQASRKKINSMRKTTTIIKDLENLQVQPNDLGLIEKQNEHSTELGHVPIDIYQTSEYETAEKIVEARGYILQERLGSGAFATVYKAWHITENVYTACKIIELKRKRKKRLNDLKHELYVFNKMDHPNIIKLFEHFLIDDKVYIFIEFAACGSLSDYIRKKGPLKETRCKKYFRQISSAIFHMHSHGITHRDIKLGNILIDEYRNLKVTDFGLSRVSYRKGKGIYPCTSYAGTEPYMAVEILKKNENNKRLYDPFIADIWAMGICLYAMANKSYPFSPDDRDSMVYNQLHRKWKFVRRQRNKISPELKDLVRHLLEPDPKRRINFLGIATHPWMQDSPETDPRQQSLIRPSVSTSTTLTAESNLSTKPQNDSAKVAENPKT